jgi:N-methylhydantoinase A
MPWKAAEFLTFRLRATAPRAPFHLRQIDAGGLDAVGAIKRRRHCWFDGQEVDAPVYDGARLLAGVRFSGPAIIEETTTTVVVPARFDCAVDQWKNYLLTRVEKGHD